MNYKSLLESVKKNVKGDVSVRRYTLSDIISESYKALYQCEEGTNLKKLAEAHLMDVRSNPTDIDRLSKQLCNLKHISSMLESNMMKDSELLVPEESHDTVEPKEERALDLKESSGSARNWEAEWHQEYMMPCRVKYFTTGKDDKIFGCIYEPDGKEFTEFGVEIYDNDKADVLAGTGFDSDADGIKSEAEAKHWVEKWFSENMPEEPQKECKAFTRAQMKETAKPEEDLDEADDDEELTEEELEELTKHLETIRKDRKSAPPAAEEKPVEESSSPRGIKVTTHRMKESAKSWDSMKEGLKNFNKNSSSKAFYKTFKKMQDRLKEGTALTRQESISLYKAANSAMTHFSVELEHNPEFLTVFKECTSMLSEDVKNLLNSLREGKAPSKKTMKSLAKFSEALLLEDEAEDEELPPIEDEEEEFISDEEGDMVSEEEESFDQEYADARVELHKELADEHADTEDPGVQEKIAQDFEEVASLPGVTEEQIAELAGESVSEESPEEEEASEESPEEEEDPDEITDDELAELKRHLTEMRKNKRQVAEAKEVFMCDAEGTPWVSKKEYEKMSKPEQEQLRKTMASSKAKGVGRYYDQWQEMEKDPNELKK